MRGRGIKWAEIKLSEHMQVASITYTPRSPPCPSPNTQTAANRLNANRQTKMIYKLARRA